MIYRIHPVGTKWQAQVKGAHSWIALRDYDGNDCTYDTEKAARCEIQDRVAKFSRLPGAGKQSRIVATEAK